MSAEPVSSTGAELSAIDNAAIVERTRELVLIPTRGGRDDYMPAVETASHRLMDAGLQPEILTDGGSSPRPVAVAATLTWGDGPHYVLDACLDTAEVGDPAAWDRDPFSGDLEGGWLHGRGSADSKAAAAIFTHLAGRLAHEDLRGKLTLLLDLDEHTGGFGGIKAWLGRQDRKPDGVMIGYPGPDKIVIGGRGVWRARITVYGKSAHSGSRHDGTNAILRAMELEGILGHKIPEKVDPGIGLPPKWTITAISGGARDAFSVVPDACVMDLDVRLTNSFDADGAGRVVAAAVENLDQRYWDPRPSVVEVIGEPWPAYRTPDDHPMVQALLAGARVAGLDPTPTVAGPSNIGCYLAQHGIAATAGFGVRYRGLHAANEAIEISTIPAVYASYYEAVRALLG